MHYHHFHCARNHNIFGFGVLWTDIGANCFTGPWRILSSIVRLSTFHVFRALIAILQTHTQKWSHQQITNSFIIFFKCVISALCLNYAWYKPLAGIRWGMDVTGWGRQQTVVGRWLSFPPAETTAPVGVCAGSPGLAVNHCMMAPTTHNAD